MLNLLSSNLIASNHQFIYLFIYLLSIYQKDGYNTKGEPVQGAIQHTTTTNTQHDIQQVHKQNKQQHYKNTKI